MCCCACCAPLPILTKTNIHLRSSYTRLSFGACLLFICTLTLHFFLCFEAHEFIMMLNFMVVIHVFIHIYHKNFVLFRVLQNYVYVYVSSIRNVYLYIYLCFLTKKRKNCGYCNQNLKSRNSPKLVIALPTKICWVCHTQTFFLAHRK